MTTAIQVSTAVGYFRVSSPGQAGERHVSLEVQQASFKDFCRAHHLTPVATFTDVASGRRDDRIQYQAMLRYIIEHGIANVVVLFLDRFGRNPREILRRYWALEEQGVRVQSVNEDLKEELLLLVRAGIAGAESKRTGERVSTAMRAAAGKGRHMGGTPFGYVKFREGSAEGWRQVPEAVSAIRLAYRLSVEENKGYRAIADELNRLGYRTKGGGVFTSQTMKLIFSNPALVGRMVFGKRSPGEPIICEGVYPAILTQDEWERLQQRLAIRREGVHRGRTDISTYLLSGIARCGHCGGPMGGASQGPTRPGGYRCVNHHHSAALCPLANTHRKGKLEAAVLEFLGRYSDPDKVRELLQAQDTQADSRQEQELAKVTARLRELEAGMLNDLDRLDRAIINETEYTKRAEVRREEQVGLQAHKGELEASVAAQRDMETQARAVPVKVRSFLEDFQGMDVRQAKAILQGIVKAAYVFKDGRIELEFRP
jgi:site-specific DNA recombinase